MQMEKREFNTECRNPLNICVELGKISTFRFNGGMISTIEEGVLWYSGNVLYMDRKDEGLNA